MVRNSIEVWQNNLLVNKNDAIPIASSLWGEVGVRLFIRTANFRWGRASTLFLPDNNPTQR